MEDLSLYGTELFAIRKIGTRLYMTDRSDNIPLWFNNLAHAKFFTRRADAQYYINKDKKSELVVLNLVEDT